jgi:hypothetical protein
MLITYLVLCYLVMFAFAFLAYSIEPEEITYKDWLIWIAAPVTVPLFILHYFNSKINQKPKNH